MAGGINHAKQIVIDEATCLAEKLQNGESGCAVTQGKAISLIVKMITPLYMNEFMTVEECENRHNTKRTSLTKIRIGPLSIEGRLSSAMVASIPSIMCCGFCVFILGKSEGWW